MRKNVLLLGAGLLTSVVLGLGIACGDDDDDGGTNGVATATEPAGTPADGLDTPADATETPEDATPEATP